MKPNPTQKKLSWREHLNYPILLLAIYSLFNLKSLVQLILLIIHHHPFIVTAVSNAIGIIATIAILIFLWLHRIEKYNKAKLVIASIIAVLAVTNTYSLITYLINTLSSVTLDIYFVVNNLPSLLTKILNVLLYSILAINLFKKTPKYVAFYILAVLLIAVQCFFGIVNVGIGNASSASTFIFTVLYIIALWYVPASLDRSASAEITKGKGKALISIFGASLILLVIALAASGGFSDGNTSYYIDYNGNGVEDIGEGVFYEDKDGNTHFYD